MDPIYVEQVTATTEESPETTPKPFKISPEEGGEGAVPLNSVAELGTEEGHCVSDAELDVVDVSRAFAVKTLTSTGDILQSARRFSTLTDPDTIRGICVTHIPTWSLVKSSDVVVSQVMAGLSNQLFIAEVEGALRAKVSPHKVLFRVYGSGVDDLYDSATEVRIFTELANMGVAPKLIACFPGGRVEEYIYGPALLVEHMSNPAIVSAVANILSKFHSIDMSHVAPIASTPQEAACFANINKWRALCSKMVKAAKALKDSSSNPTDADGLIDVDSVHLGAGDSTPNRRQSVVAIADCLNGMGLAERKSFLDSFLDTGLEDILKDIENDGEKIIAALLPEGQGTHMATTMKFCHNDVQENNILCSKTRLRLIDFEYSGYSYPAWDIANFFCEMTQDYCVEEAPFFRHETDPTKFPSKELIGLFGSVYLSGSSGNSYFPDSPEVKEFVNIIYRFSLLSSVLWGLWGIIRAPQAATASDFDYLLYSKSRFTGYFRMKQHLIDQGILKPY